jgi:hypothetical protein
MFIQKIKIILPDEVIELVYNKNDDYIKYNSEDLNKFNRNIILYITFDIYCPNNNNFELYLYHKEYEWKDFSILISPPSYYISKIEYKVMFNKLSESFYIV